MNNYQFLRSEPVESINHSTFQPPCSSYRVFSPKHARSMRNIALHLKYFVKTKFAFVRVEDNFLHIRSKQALNVTMKCMVKVFLIICCLASSSRSLEDTRLTLKTEFSSITTSVPTSTTSTRVLSQAANNTDLIASAEAPKPKQLPVDLSPDKVFLDPNVVLARVTRDTYGSGYYSGWNQRQSFGNPYVRRPFGIQKYYNMPQYNRPNRLGRPEPPRRRNANVRRVQVNPRPFKVYPVFPG